VSYLKWLVLLTITPEVTLTEYKKVAYAVRESLTTEATSNSRVLPIREETGGYSLCEWSKAEEGDWYFKVDIIDSASKVVATAKTDTFKVYSKTDESDKKKTDLAFENISITKDPVDNKALELTFDVVNYGANVTTFPEDLTVKVYNKTTQAVFITQGYKLSDFVSGKKTLRRSMLIDGQSLKEGKNLLAFVITHNFAEDNKLNNSVEKWVDTTSLTSLTTENPETPATPDPDSLRLPDLVLNDVQIFDEKGVPYVKFIINNKGGAIANGYIISVKAVDVETGDVYASGYSNGLSGVKEILSAERLAVKKTGSVYKLKAEIDYAGIIRESNENNNTLEKTLSITNAQATGLPDLVLNDVQIFDEKGVLYLKFIINNKGGATQNGQIISVKAEDVETGDVYSSGYSSGLSGVKEILSAGPLAVKKTVSPYKLKVEIDHAGIIKESNESNNTLERTLTMTKSQPIKVENNSNEKDLLIIKLKRQITELETKLVETEKKLVTKVDNKLIEKIKGKILLQVEEKGEAWYVDPISENKLYLKDGQSAYDIMRILGLGISNVNLEKIPVGVQPSSDSSVELDTDDDGLSDDLEKALGSDPSKADTDNDGYKDDAELKTNYQINGKGRQSIDNKLTTRLKGRIVLQVENKGEAWYINPSDGKRYFLGNGDKAYQIMRELSLGINNSDLRKINVGEFVTE
jgi:hypothetical protein